MLDLSTNARAMLAAAIADAALAVCAFGNVDVVCGLAMGTPMGSSAPPP